MRIGLRYLGKLLIQTSRGVRNPAWDVGESSGMDCITWVSSMEVEWELWNDLFFGICRSLPLSVVSRVSYWKAMSRNFSRHITSIKCHRNTKWNHWGHTQKPNHQTLLSEALALFTSLVSICARVIKQLFFFLLLGTSLFSHQGLPFCGGSTHPKDLPQRPQNRSNCISTWIALSLSKESSSPIILLTIYGKFGLGAPFTDIKFTMKL